MFLINRLPSKVINNDTPFFRLFGHEPDYTSLRTFGCACWSHLRPYNTKKLEFRSKQCVFLGYSNQHKGFKCLDPKTGRVYISRDVVFYEKVFPIESLHPNAGAQLRAELTLLPDVLLNSSSVGVTSTPDHGLFSPVPANASQVPVEDVFGAEKNPSGNRAENGEGEKISNRHFMCSRDGSSAGHEADSPDGFAGGAGGSS